MSARRTVARRRTNVSAEMPPDSEVRAAGERNNPTEPSPPPQTPKDDPELQHGLMALTSRVSEIMATVENWSDTPAHCDVMSVFEQLSELNLAIWRVRWNGGSLSDHEVAS